MVDFAWSFALHMAGLLAFAALLRVTGRRVAIGPLLIAVGTSAVYWTAEVLGASAKHYLPVMSHLHWNWMGKALAMVVSLAVIALLPRMTRAEAGFTLRQKAGWLLPVLLVMAASCALAWTVHALGHEGPGLAPEQLLFQATMPGLDEELFFRGALLALLIRAFGPGREVARASFGAAEIAVTLLFAAAHGLLISKGAIAFDATSFIVSGLLGAGLMWLRNRTGSLVIPILTHNLINFGECFF
jgi:membrane protease YdiL (CAAX protease family)